MIPAASGSGKMRMDRADRQCMSRIPFTLRARPANDRPAHRTSADRPRKPEHGANVTPPVMSPADLRKGCSRP